MRAKFFVTLSAAMLAMIAIGSAHAQSECQPKPATKQSPLAACRDRIGHCVDVKMGSAMSELIADTSLNAKLSKSLTRDKPCWKVAHPVPADFELSNVAKPGTEEWLGDVNSVGLVLYALDDFDEALGKPIAPTQGANVVDGRIKIGLYGGPGKPLAPGDYVGVFRFFGSKNWERQSIYFTVSK